MAAQMRLPILIAIFTLGFLLASVSGGSVRLKAQEARTIRVGSGVLVQCVALSPDGRTCAVGLGDQIGLWDATTGVKTATIVSKPKRDIPHRYSSTLSGADFSVDGKSLACCREDGIICVWKAPFRNEPLILGANHERVECVRFSADGRLLVAGGRDGDIRVWNLSQRKLALTMRGHEDWVWSVVFSPSGKMIASGSEDSTAKVWDATNGKEMRSFAEDPGYDGAFRISPAAVRGVAFSPDEKTLFSGNTSGKIHIWDIQTGREKGVLVTPQWVRGVSSCVSGLYSLSDNRTVIASDFHGGVCEWDPRRQKLVGSLRIGTPPGVESMAVSRDERWILCGGSSGTATLLKADRLRRHDERNGGSKSKRNRNGDAASF
jgi:WD40 repeat protein